MVLEQNAFPGLANRLLARVVQAAALTYPETLPYFRTVGFVSGNPVRPEFLRPGPSEPRSSATAARVLVFGGSQGAHAINVAFVEAMRCAGRSMDQIEITHQTGEPDLDFVRSAYRDLGVSARVQPFFHEMGREMSRADLVVSRAGATTLAELAALGRPAVLVPLPSATNDHQRRNAVTLATAGAAVVLEQRDLDGPRMWAQLSALCADRGRLESMSQAMGRFARPDAAVVIADRALALVGGRGPGRHHDAGGPMRGVD
jgi:UDP-N-acetylglucosamine--N-acetylmuramyl-(pentapeptide) pyrophosphoryl-undecaprenol N-acetylglucosamine transferase